MKTTSRTVTAHNAEITRSDILEFLRAKGVIADNAVVEQVSVRVPGGGDYSNCDILINDYEGEESLGIDVVWNTSGVS